MTYKSTKNEGDERPLNASGQQSAPEWNCKTIGTYSTTTVSGMTKLYPKRVLQ
jgi:hypothetical protein